MLGITAICKEICLGQYKIHVLIRLYHAIFLSTLLFNCQTLARIRKYDIDTLAVVQLRYLKQALRVPYSTPNIVVYLEMGLLPIEYVIDFRCFIYLHHILMLTNGKPVNSLYYQQLELAFEENLANEIHHLAKQCNIIVEEGYVKSLSRVIYVKSLSIANIITEYGFNQLKSK